MTCSHCGKKVAQGASRCPGCGESTTSGMFQTSTVLISSGGADRVYRSVEEVPQALRTRLLKSTNGANSGTILIADRRGRKEIAKAMRHLPANAQRRLMHSILAGDSGNAPKWLGPRRRKAIFAAVLMLALAAVGLVFSKL